MKFLRWLLLGFLGVVQAQVPISGLPNATIPLGGGELIPCVQSGATAKCTPSEINSLITLAGLGGVTLGQVNTQIASQVNAPYIGALIYPQTSAELAVGQTPVNIYYPPGDPRRWGAVGGVVGSIPSTDDSIAMRLDANAGLVTIPCGMAFKFVTGITTTAPVVISGCGKLSELYCDSYATSSEVTQNFCLNGTGATGSVVQNVSIKGITTPLTIQRYIETNITTTATLTGGSAVIVVGSATGIVQGQEVYGYGIAPGTYVQSVAAPNVTLTSPVLESDSGDTYTFYGVTWNSAWGYITGISQASSAVVTVNNNNSSSSSVNPFVVGEVLGFSGVTGMTQINGLSGTVTAIGGSSGAWTATLNINSSGFSAFTACPSYGSASYCVAGQALATLATSNSTGRYAPGLNDIDVFYSLTNAQKQQAQTGPVLYLVGDNVTISGVLGKGLSVLLSGNHEKAVDNNFQGGWTWANIALLSSTPVPVDFYAVGNSLQDHSYSGIAVEGVVNSDIEHNWVKGTGEVGYKQDGQFTQGSTFVGDWRITSIGNTSVAGYQGSFDFESAGLPLVTPSAANSISTGDRSDWSGPLGGIGLSGSGWDVDDVVTNSAGPAFYANVDHSRIKLVAIENSYNNLNLGVANTVTVIGGNNTSEVTVHQLTSRARPGYSLAYYGGATSATSSSLVNSDVRDSVVSDGNTLQTSNFVDIFNLRGNGPLSDVPIGATRQVTIAQSTTVTPNAGLGKSFVLNLSSNSATTIALPTNMPFGPVEIQLVVQNNTGVSFTLGFAAGYHTPTITAQANGTQRTYTFVWNGVSLYQKYSTVDVAL